MSRIKILFSILLVLSASLFADSDTPDYDPATQVLTMPAVTMYGEAAFTNVILDLDFDNQTFGIISLENEQRSPLELEALGGDRFRFAATAGQDYVVEIYNVPRSYESASGYECSGSWRTGLGLKVSDPLGSTVAEQCSPNGYGKVYTQVLVEAGLSGDFEIHVIANDGSDPAGYRIRVQPAHDDAGASWHPQSYEPNNRAVNAYGIDVGYENKLNSSLSERNSSFAAQYADRDWYQFTATVGTSYFVELFNVERGIGNESGYDCSGSWRTGLGLWILDPTLTEVVSRCDASGTGNVHNHVSFKAGVSGTFYVGVIPNSATTAGKYSVRVSADHENSAASWSDSSREPNNSVLMAYALQIGEGGAISSNLQELNTSYATNRPDYDWYRIDAAASTDYEIQLLNVAGTATNVSGYLCSGSWRTGLGLVVWGENQAFIAEQCDASGTGNIHNSLTFRSGLAGTYYIGVIPNAVEGYGSYRIQVLRR